MNEDLKTSRKAEHLTKEQELELGGTIQEMIAAKSELESNPDLSSTRINELKQKVRDGDRAVETLVTANVGLVYDRVRIFKTRWPSAIEFDDLVQEGMIGLMTAISKYDPARGNKFSTVAYYWIAQAVARGANKTGRLVRLPENRINDYTKMNRITASLDDSNLKPAEVDKVIMDELNLSKTDILNIRSAAGNHASLNRVISTDGGTKELIDYVANDRTVPSSEDHAVSKDLDSILVRLVDGLPDLRREALKSSFAVFSESLTPDEVKSKYDLTHSAYRRHTSEALSDIRKNLDSQGLSLVDFLE